MAGLFNSRVSVLLSLALTLIKYLLKELITVFRITYKLETGVLNKG